MKLAGLESIDAGVRSAILISVAVAYFAFDLGFEFGAHGPVFFDKVFFVWSIALALLIIFIIIPRERLSVPRMLWVATAIPTLWALVALANRAAPGEVLMRHGLTVLGLAVVLFCTPYLVYVITSVIYPEFTKEAGLAPKLGISIVVVVLVVVGFIVGSNHDRFLTRRDFELAGNHVPVDCSRK